MVPTKLFIVIVTLFNYTFSSAETVTRVGPAARALKAGKEKETRRPTILPTALKADPVALNANAPSDPRPKDSRLNSKSLSECIEYAPPSIVDSYCTAGSEHYLGTIGDLIRILSQGNDNVSFSIVNNQVTVDRATFAVRPSLNNCTVTGSGESDNDSGSFVGECVLGFASVTIFLHLENIAQDSCNACVPESHTDYCAYNVEIPCEPISFGCTPSSSSGDKPHMGRSLTQSRPPSTSLSEGSNYFTEPSLSPSVKPFVSPSSYPRMFPSRNPSLEPFLSQSLGTSGISSFRPSKALSTASSIESSQCVTASGRSCVQ